MNITYNLFDLSTAKAAFANNENSLPTRIFNAGTGAAYDMYAKNPYDMTLGNGKRFMKDNIPQSRKIKIGTSAAIFWGVLSTLMLYGTTLHITGRSIQALSHKMNINLLSTIGKITATIGKHLFITGAVPLYALFYALPKYIVLSTPKLLNFIADTIKSIASFVFKNVLKPLFEKILLPLSEHMVQGFKFIATKLSKGMEFIRNLTEKVAVFVFENLLRPLFEKILFPFSKYIVQGFKFIKNSIEKAALFVFENVLRPLFEKILLPISEHIVQGFKFIGTKVYEGMNLLKNLIKTVASFIFKNLLKLVFKPIVQGFKFIAIKLFKGIEFIKNLTEKVATSIFENIIKPIGNDLILPILKIANKTLFSVLNRVGCSLKTLIKATVNVAYFIFEKMLHPIFLEMTQLVVVGKNFLKSYIIEPLSSLLSCLANRVGLILKTIFNEILKPTIYGIKQGFTAIGGGLFSLKTEIVESVTSVWHRISQIF